MWFIVMALACAAALPGQVGLPVSATGPVTVAVSARAIQPGEIVRLTIRTSSRSVRVSATGTTVVPFRLDDSTWQALVGLDLDTPAGPYMLTIDTGAPDAPLTTTHELIVEPKEFPVRRLRVAPRYVEPPAAELARILGEAERLNVVFRTSAPDRAWTGPFLPPVPDQANSAFGSRSVFNGQPRSPHGGADFRSPSGRPVRAPNSGTVVLAGDLYYTGGTVVVDHGAGLVSLFAHLSRIDVKEGSRVEGGEVLGLVGATGRVTGPHLHWTLRLGGARVDPLSLLAIEGASLRKVADGR